MVVPRLSIVIATKNRSDRLAGAIESALAQTETDVEVIVVDDCSDDATPKVIEAHAAKDRRVRGLRQRRPSGAAATRNRGIGAANGEFVAFLDDDDRWVPYKASTQLEFFAANPAASAVSCQYEIVSENDGNSPMLYAGPASCTSGDLLWCNFVGGASVVMIRRDAFAELPAFDTELVTCEDWDFHMQCAAAGPIAILPEVLCRYTVHDDGRLTNPLQLRTGRIAWLRKHAAAMSAECLAYHRARLRVLGSGDGGARAALAVKIVATSSARVTRLIAEESLAARLGQRAGDPGRGMRRLHELIQPR
jgi:glycosyltransferase involved in cell wall biosynthesis